MDNNLLPAVLVTPGEILRAELDERGMSQKELAVIMGRPEQAISEIINAKKQITADTALELEAALGISAQFWLNLEATYQLDLARTQKRHDAIEQRRRLLDLPPVKHSLRKGWITRPQDASEFAQAVKAFFGFDPLSEAPPLPARFRHATMQGPDIMASWAWLRRVELLAEARPIPEFDRNRLRKGIPELLSYAERSEDVVHVRSTLAKFGVYLAIVPHLEKTYLDGAACFFGGKGVAALTLRYDRIDSFWFTLLHEIAHLLEYDSICYLDSLPLPARGDFAGSSDGPSPEERRANAQAQEWLVPRSLLDELVAEVAPRFSREAIEDFARSIHRHPGIVLGRLMREGHVKYSALRDMLDKVKPRLQNQIDA